MFTLSVEASFEAGHYLPNYPGKCAKSHGHSWLIKSFYKTIKQDSLGISFDFKDLKRELRNALAIFDHSLLNEIMTQPTAENIAKEVYLRLRSMQTGAFLVSVTVEETSGCIVNYEPSESENHQITQHAKEVDDVSKCKET